jgi:hypothetical protein
VLDIRIIGFGWSVIIIGLFITSSSLNEWNNNNKNINLKNE